MSKRKQVSLSFNPDNEREREIYEMLSNTGNAAGFLKELAGQYLEKQKERQYIERQYELYKAGILSGEERANSKNAIGFMNETSSPDPEPPKPAGRAGWAKVERHIEF
jgi:hypothetical protein